MHGVLTITTFGIRMCVWKGVDFMTTSNINIRVDSRVKADAEELFNKIGMNMSTAMNIFLRQSIRYGGIPFEIRLNEVNEVTRAAIEDVENNRNLSRTYENIQELIDDLNVEN